MGCRGAALWRRGVVTFEFLRQPLNLAKSDERHLNGRSITFPDLKFGAVGLQKLSEARILLQYRECLTNGQRAAVIMPRREVQHRSPLPACRGLLELTSFGIPHDPVC